MPHVIQNVSDKTYLGKQGNWEPLLQDAKVFGKTKAGAERMLSLRGLTGTAIVVHVKHTRYAEPTTPLCGYDGERHDHGPCTKLKNHLYEHTSEDGTRWLR